MLRLRSRRRPTPRKKPRGGRRLRQLEPLESRALLSAISVVDSILAQPAIDPLAVTNPTPRGYTPAQVKQLYSFSGVTFNGSIQGDGTGQTIAIVDAYNDPNIASDLHVFDTTFGLPDPKLTVINQTGGTRLPATDAGWSQEIALDVEWAHAMAPGANIVLVEANSSSIADLMAAVNTARNYPGVSVVSMSWGSGEFSSERQYDQYFTTPAGHTPVTFIASAGDSGAQATWPAVSPNVMAVGGTTLSSSGSETAWSGSGGGYSRFETEPTFQRTVQTTGVRTSPDVSYNANPNTGFAVYDTVSVGGRSGWFEIGGTSAGAPQWAALVAIANQGRALSGQAALSGAQSNLYSLASTDFRDVVSGSNGYAAKAGYDLVTGRGSPIASSVIRDLVGSAAVTSGGTNTAGTTQSTGTTQPVVTQPSPSQRYELVYWNHRWWLFPIGSAAAIDSDTVDTVVIAAAVPPTPAPSDASDARSSGSENIVASGTATQTGTVQAAGQTALLQVVSSRHLESLQQTETEQDTEEPEPTREPGQVPNEAPSNDIPWNSFRHRGARAIDFARVIDSELFAAEQPLAGWGAFAPEQPGVALAAAHEACFAADQWLDESPEPTTSLASSKTLGFAAALGFLTTCLAKGSTDRQDDDLIVALAQLPRRNRVRSSGLPHGRPC
jgi:hypothetical protein